MTKLMTPAPGEDLVARPRLTDRLRTLPEPPRGHRRQIPGKAISRSRTRPSTARAKGLEGQPHHPLEIGPGGSQVARPLDDETTGPGPLGQLPGFLG